MDLTTRDQRRWSSLTYAANSAGVLPPGSEPRLASRCTRSGAVSALRISLLILATSAAGVPAGAKFPFHAEMIGAADADRGVVEPAGAGFGKRDEILQSGCGHAGMHHQQLRHDNDHADRREIAKGVVRQLLHQQRIDDETRGRAVQQRITCSTGRHRIH